MSRAQAHFPTIQITMVSIVVALALQQWLDRLPTIDAMWEPTLVAVRIWCQALTAAVIIVKMWTGFVLAGIVDERVPRPIDLLGPIGILVFVDAQIMNIGVEHVLRWWYILGTGSLVAGVYIAVQTRIGARVLRSADERNGLSQIRLDSRHPEIVEVFIGSLAIAIAVLHQTLTFGETGMLAACALILVVELVSAVGPLIGWHALRKMEERR